MSVSFTYSIKSDRIIIRGRCDSGPLDGTTRLLISGAGICTVLLPCRRSRECHRSLQDLTYDRDVSSKAMLGHYMAPGASAIRSLSASRQGVQCVYHCELASMLGYPAPPMPYTTQHRRRRIRYNTANVVYRAYRWHGWSPLVRMVSHQFWSGKRLISSVLRLRKPAAQYHGDKLPGMLWPSGRSV